MYQELIEMLHSVDLTKELHCAVASNAILVVLYRPRKYLVQVTTVEGNRISLQPNLSKQFASREEVAGYVLEQFPDLKFYNCSLK